MIPRHLAIAVGLLLTYTGAYGQSSQPSVPDLPRYKLPVGRQLTYSSVTDSEPTKPGGGAGFSSSGTVELTVVRENADGSRRIVVRTGTKSTERFNGESRGLPERVNLSYADVFPDGQTQPNPTLNVQAGLTLVPRLPASAPNSQPAGSRQIRPCWKQITLPSRPAHHPGANWCSRALSKAP